MQAADDERGQADERSANGERRWHLHHVGKETPMAFPSPQALQEDEQTWYAGQLNAALAANHRLLNAAVLLRCQWRLRGHIDAGDRAAGPAA